jgi:O-antigen/teichoic acid export membrane protein
MINKKQVAINLIANLTSAMFGLLISFFMTPFVVRQIGSEAYAFVPMSVNFVTYFAVIAAAFTSMVARSVTLYMHRRDIETAQAVYSTSFYANVMLSGVLAILTGALIPWLDRIIQIPTGLIKDVRWLFVFMFLTFFTNLLHTVFTVKSYSLNRLDIHSRINIITVLIKVGLLLGLYGFLSPKIYFFGLATWLSVLCGAFMHFYYSTRILPEIRIQRSAFRSDLVKSLVSSGSWNAFNQLSTVLMSGLDILLANWLLGPREAGILAIAKTLPIAVQTLINVVPATFGPYLTIAFSTQSIDTYKITLSRVLRLSAGLVSLPIAGLLVLVPAFMSLWIPEVANSSLFILTWLSLGSIIGNFAAQPLLHVFVITNHVKWPAVVTFCGGVLNLVVVLALVQCTDYDIYAIAGISGLIDLLRSNLFVPMYAAHCLKLPKWTFYPLIGRIGAAFVGLVGIYTSLVLWLNPTSWLTLALVIGLFGSVGMVWNLVFVASPAQVRFGMDVLRGKIKA